MAITKMGMLVVVVGLLAMVQQSVQMSSSSMLKETGNDLSSWAIVFSRRTSERVLLESGDFEHRSTEIIAGRVFRTGLLIGRRVVLVNTGKYSANVASALQIALSTYRIRGVLYFGNAGDLTGGKAAAIGHVIIPKCVAFSAIWDWLSPDANPEGHLALQKKKEGHLVFGDFNKGENQQNALGSVKFNNVTLYTGQNDVSSLFCLKTDEEWMKKALDVKEQLPQITIHLRRVGASSDMKIYNEAYANFLYKSFGFACADEESATVALVSKSNDKPYMVFHGVSNIVPRPPTEDGKQKAAKNAYTVLKTFLSLLPEPRGYITTYV